MKQMNETREKSSKAENVLEAGQNKNGLTAGEARYRTIFSECPDALLLETLDGRIVDCNEAACKMHGYPREEMLRLNAADLAPESIGEKMSQIINNFANTTTGDIFVWVSFKHKDGHHFPVKLSMRLVNIEGHPMFLACARDPVPSSPKDSPLPVGWVNQYAPVSSITWQYVDGDFVMLGFNSSAEELMRGSITALVGRTANAIYNDRLDIIEDFKRCYHEKTVYMKRMQYEIPVTGEKKDVAITYVYLPPNMVVTNIEEIFDFPHIPHSGVNEEGLWRARYQRIPLPSLTWRREDGEFILIDYNRAAVEYSDGSIQEYVGQAANILFNNQPSFIDGLVRCANGEDMGKLEISYRMSSRGPVRHTLCSFNYAPPDLVFTHMEDITRRKKAEEGLEKSRKDLRSLSSKLIKAEEKERKRIAHELHDSLGQSLTAIKYTTESIINRMTSEGSPSRHIELLTSLIPRIQQAVKEVRDISIALRPSMLDDLGIVETIFWFCAEFESIYLDIHVNKDIHVGEKNIPKDLKTTMFRVLQESLNNVAKHSRADHVHVSLEMVNESIILAIEDNGMGFDVESVLAKKKRMAGLGIDSMRNRVELTGGILALESGIGKGASVRAVWHLKSLI